MPSDSKIIYYNISVCLYTVAGGGGIFSHMEDGQNGKGTGTRGIGAHGQMTSTPSSGVNRPGVPSDYNSRVQTSWASFTIPIPK